MATYGDGNHSTSIGTTSTVSCNAATATTGGISDSSSTGTTISTNGASHGSAVMDPTTAAAHNLISSVPSGSSSVPGRYVKAGLFVERPSKPMPLSAQRRVNLNFGSLTASTFFGGRTSSANAQPNYETETLHDDVQQAYEQQQPVTTYSNNNTRYNEFVVPMTTSEKRSANNKHQHQQQQHYRERGRSEEAPPIHNSPTASSFMRSPPGRTRSLDVDGAASSYYCPRGEIGGVGGGGGGSGEPTSTPLPQQGMYAYPQQDSIRSMLNAPGTWVCTYCSHFHQEKKKGGSNSNSSASDPKKMFCKGCGMNRCCTGESSIVNAKAARSTRKTSEAVQQERDAQRQYAMKLCMDESERDAHGNKNQWICEYCAHVHYLTGNQQKDLEYTDPNKIFCQGCGMNRSGSGTEASTKAAAAAASFSTKPNTGDEHENSMRSVSAQAMDDVISSDGKILDTTDSANAIGTDKNREDSKGSPVKKKKKKGGGFIEGLKKKLPLRASSWATQTTTWKRSTPPSSTKSPPADSDVAGDNIAREATGQQESPVKSRKPTATTENKITSTIFHHGAYEYENIPPPSKAIPDGHTLPVRRSSISGPLPSTMTPATPADSLHGYNDCNGMDQGTTLPRTQQPFIYNTPQRQPSLRRSSIGGYTPDSLLGNDIHPPDPASAESWLDLSIRKEQQYHLQNRPTPSTPATEPSTPSPVSARYTQGQQKNPVRAVPPMNPFDLFGSALSTAVATPATRFTTNVAGSMCNLSGNISDSEYSYDDDPWAPSMTHQDHNDLAPKSPIRSRSTSGSRAVSTGTFPVIEAADDVTDTDQQTVPAPVVNRTNAGSNPSLFDFLASNVPPSSGGQIPHNPHHQNHNTGLNDLLGGGLGGNAPGGGGGGGGYLGHLFSHKGANQGPVDSLNNTSSHSKDWLAISTRSVGPKKPSEEVPQQGPAPEWLST